MDAEAKHYRAMKGAVWLYLYLLLAANRRSGFLMRKIATASKDMGVPRDTVQRWLKVLRAGGYIETVNTGRSLTIQVTRWKALAGVGKARLHASDLSNFRHAKYPMGGKAPDPAIPLRIGAVSGPAAVGNERKIIKKINNELSGAIAKRRTDQGLTGIGASVRRELLAQELARELNDVEGIDLYRSYSVKYPEWLLRKVLSEVETVRPKQIFKGRSEIFKDLVQHYAKGAT